MQNKGCSANEAGFVALNGGWMCGRCGCANEACDQCNHCGWNRCGCQGGIVSTAATATTATVSSQTRCGCQTAQVRQSEGVRCACENAQARQSNCPTCPREGGMPHGVQCCPANTTLRPLTSAAASSAASSAAVNNGCGCAVAANNACGCGCTAATNNACGCGCTVAANGGRNAVRQTECPTAAGVGMVYAVKQEMGDVYQSESALRTGTLFPELNKPMNGRCPGNCNASTTGQQSGFAAWDLRLYLDTHPDDPQALALFGQLAREAEDPCYATAFLTGGSGWTWTDEPWPWECQGQKP